MKSTAGSILSNIAVNILCVYGWMGMVVLRDSSLSHIEDFESRRWLQYDIVVSKRAVIKVIFHLEQLDEKRISIEMKGLKGAVLFDASLNKRMNCVAMFASYCKTCLVRENGTLHEIEVPHISTLAISPMLEKALMKPLLKKRIHLMLANIYNFSAMHLISLDTISTLGAYV